MTGGTRAPAAAKVASATKTATASKTTQPTNPGTYKVKRGDTLTSIAAKFNVTVNDLKKWNKLTSSRLDIGQKLALAPANIRQAN